MFSLLHLHFESTLRAIAAVHPFLLPRLSDLFGSTVYRSTLPAQRLRLFEEQIQVWGQIEGLFTEAVFTRVVQTFVRELVQSQVEHADLRIGVKPGKWSWMATMAEGMEIFRRELAGFSSLSLSFLAAVNLSKPLTELDEIFDLLLTDRWVRASFVGMDLNLSPADLPKLKRFAPALHLARQQGLKINLHLGELFDNAFTQEVLALVIPDRIGHGVRLLDDERLVAWLRQQDICLDMCPVSNTLLGIYDWHQPNDPAKRAWHLGLPVTINTDNPMLFQTTLARELELAGLTTEEIQLIQQTGRTYRYG